MYIYSNTDPSKSSKLGIKGLIRIVRDSVKRGLRNCQLEASRRQFAVEASSVASVRKGEHSPSTPCLPPQHCMFDLQGKFVLVAITCD